ncbi:MAG: MFS transporter [Alphaproteobacteria bacterium]|nr:MFS transporter [Alphaproteobacteria bacterium]
MRWEHAIPLSGPQLRFRLDRAADLPVPWEGVIPVHPVSPVPPPPGRRRTALFHVPQQTLALIGDRDFRTLWLTGSLAEVMRWMEILAISIFVYMATESTFVVTMVNLARAIPMVLLGAVSGAIADRIDRRKLLIGGTLLLMTNTAVLAILAAANAIEIWHLAVGGFVNGLMFSTEFPVRRNLLGDFAGLGRIGTAMGLDAVTRNATRIIGPSLGGLALQFIGLDGAFALASVVNAFAAAMIWRVASRPSPTGGRPGTGVLANVVDGLRFFRSNRLIVGFLSVTVIMNIWAFPYMNLVPAIGRQVLRLEPFPLSLLAAAEGCGATLGSLALALIDRPQWYLRYYVGGSALFMSGIFLFSFSQSYALSLAILFVGGFGIAGFTTMQGTLPFVLAPPEWRARLMGVLSVCVGTSPIGIIHLGLLSGWVGAPTTATITASEALFALALALIFVIAPTARRQSAKDNGPRGK